MKKELQLEKLPYPKDSLSPIMSEDTIKYHRDKLAAGYVNRFNSGEGDSDFNEAGAFLHNIFFPQLKPPAGRNLPHGSSLQLIEDNFSSFDSFKDAIKSEAMKIQGSGWIYMDSKGSIKTIKNHQIKNGIVLLIDWWEHAWALDYQSDKAKYLDNIWKIINWDVVNDRINTSKKSLTLDKTSSIMDDLVKLADHLDSSGLVYHAMFVDEIIKEAAKAPFGYLAAFIDDTTKENIKKWWMKETKKPFLDNQLVHHMTIKFKPTLEEIEEAPLGDEVELKIDGWAADEKGQAIAVSGFRSSNEVPHITISTAEGVGAKYSNNLLGQGLHEIIGPTFKARIGFFRDSDKERIFSHEDLGVSTEKTLSKEASKKKTKPKRTPTKPELWSRAKAKAKAKYDVWPSAYAIGFALKEYKRMGGGWRGKKPVK